MPPVIIPRSEHPISRQNIDPDALKVLYRLRQFNYVAYLVGGSVRDLLLERTPKDFDIGTSAHPYQVKRLFRNCWIIGRRFRLAHVKFGTKVIEVATFRRQIPAGTEEEPAPVFPVQDVPVPEVEQGDPDLLIHHDNTFGTPEQDAFRRDFTLNALFYDIESLSIIDYVGGLDDIRARIIRCIGDPGERFQEDPVRMLRAVALAARLDFAIDPPVLQAIERYRGELARSAPARLMEEIYKVMRAGAAEKTFRSLVDTGLLAAIAPEVPGRITPGFWHSLAAIDQYRRGFTRNPEALVNALLLGSLLIPLGLLDQHHGRTKELGARFGILPLARRDVEFLRQILQMQRHLRDVNAPSRHKRSTMHRSAFPGALMWLELHGNAPEIVEGWRALEAEVGAEHPEGAQPPADAVPRRRRRRRRRRNFRPAGT
ncbi:MAG: polynucleotide adenylyltransferase PcnB [Vicinamibacterales bacterium]|nr:polynucleotide adenylyltransferase PcnB [Vicinamibacterales bacterium]